MILFSFIVVLFFEMENYNQGNHRSCVLNNCFSFYTAINASTPSGIPETAMTSSFSNSRKKVSYLCIKVTIAFAACC